VSAAKTVALNLDPHQCRLARRFVEKNGDFILAVDLPGMDEKDIEG
jgi:HSP20 family molecular chaperone IbpA